MSRLSEELRSRTKKYASDVIQFYVSLPKGRKEVQILGQQLLRSGTSVAAHSREASRARSNSEFSSKLGGALQEADETALWLELLAENCGVNGALNQHLQKETGELIGIFTTMVAKLRC